LSWESIILKLPNSGRRYRFNHQAEVCDPSNRILASNALSSSRSWLLIFGFGQQSRGFNRIATLSAYTINILSSHGLQSPGYFHLGASSASIAIQGQFESSTSISYSYMHSKFPESGGNIPFRMPYVKYEGKSTVRNTRWPGIRIKRALPSNFPYLRYKTCTDGRIGCLSLNWTSTR
jgi:hypothetical protein